MSGNKQISIIEIADAVGGELIGDSNIIISGVSSLKEAKEGDISFLGNKKYAFQVKESSASAARYKTNSFDFESLHLYIIF